MKRDALVIVTRRTIIAGTSVLLVGCADAAREDAAGEDANAVDDDGAEDGNESDDATPEDDNPATPEDDNPATGEVTQIGELTLTSPAFDDGERIPEKYGYDAENVNPPLAIENGPDDAESLALVVDDPDAIEPAGKVWDHWIVWNVPPDTSTIPEDWQPTDAEEGTNDFGETGYAGPSPPDGEHRYRFKLFALDATLDLPPQTDAEALGDAMDGRIVEQTQLDGTYPA